MNSVCICEINSEFKVNPRNRKWNEKEFAKKIVNWKWIHKEDRESKVISRKLSLSLSLIIFEFTNFFENSLQIHYFYREFALNSLPSSWIHNEFTIYFTNSQRMHCYFRDFTFNSLSISLIHFKFTISLANSLSIHYLFREFTTKIHYMFREFTTKIHY